MTEQLVPLDDVTLCIDEVGDPDDPVVLLLSGAAASMDWWTPAWCDLLAAGGRRVVRYDHRDTGRSTTFPPGAPPYDGGALSRDAIGLVELLGAPVHLVGVSMGGGIAQDLALRRPDLVASLTLVATSAVGGVTADLPGPQPAVTATFADPPPDPDWTDREQVVEWFLAGERTFSGSLGVDEAAVRAAAEAVFDRAHDLAAAAHHWSLAGDDDGPPLDVHDITAPTLVVHGSDDPFFPLPHGEALASAVPGARLLVVDGMGHQVPPASTWHEVVPAILEHTAPAPAPAPG